MLLNIFQYGFAGIAGLCLLGAWLSRSRRSVFAWAAISAGSAAVAAHYNVFWALVTFGLMVPWALLCAGPWIDFAWRAKTGFVLFLALGSAVCIYPTYHDERYGRPDQAGLSSEERSEQETKAQRGELGFSRFLTSNVPFRMVRGLDLKGGLRLVYTVDVDEAINDKRDRYYDDLRAALATAFGFHQGDKPPTIEEMQKLQSKLRIEKSRESSDTITITFNDPADAEKINDEFLSRFLGELQIQRSADRSVAKFRIRDEVSSGIRERAVTQAKETVLRRVDGLGLKEASVTTRDEDVIVEVPGDDDRAFDQIRDIISQTARLEFKMVDDDTDFFEPIAKSAKEADLPKGLTFSIENAPVGPNKTKPVHFARMVRGEHEEMRDTLKRLREWVGTLQVPPDNEVGYGKLYEYDEEKDAVEEIGWRTYFLFSKAEITGDMVRDAQALPDQSEGSLGGWYVSMDFTPTGADRFEDITGRNIKRRFAIILDEKVESAPVIQTKIGGGRAQITMGSQNPDQQLQDARKLELVLRSGALPAPISPSNEQRIGPSLGKDAINQAVKGAIASSMLVLGFMVLIYSRAGLIADIAVIFNLVLQVAILAMFGASMTLPGIAGLALTIGIAVDANVLINERIREELRNGKSPRAAVDVGYDKAFSAILDGHVTTLISGLILMQYGTGPIKGFAVTLIVGIAVSLFTGVVCTRLMFDWAVRGRKVKTLSLG
ncbi:preprotein translocase subunit SecD [Sorangium cellulosum]|uniref:Protein translocase subunit SecD n=1 Tax=Sorangium cellulosum TaxID=56 RepID=A0A2L0EXS7_SORCE|nr:protein translocase subunit SecD [Sorangium cellulosum]AUX44102.1 preprotein translocase subunit SecD [Sorangium cellulosum]